MEAKNIVILIVMGIATLAAGGLAIYQFLDQVKTEEKNEEDKKLLNQQITALINGNNELRRNSEVLRKGNEELIKSSTTIRNGNKRLTEYSEMLVKKNLELSNQADKIKNETLKFVIGDGYPNIEIFGIGNDQYRFVLRNYGNYPIYDVYLEISFIDKIKDDCVITNNGSYSTMLSQCHASYTQTLTTSTNVRPGGGHICETTFPIDTGVHHVEFTIVTRAMAVKYRMIVEKNADGIGVDYRVYTSKDGIYTLLDGGPNRFGFDDKYWKDHFLPDRIKLVDR